MDADVNGNSRDAPALPRCGFCVEASLEICAAW